MTTNTTPRTLDGYQLARIVSTWLPAKDEAIALRMIRHHEQQHATAEMAMLLSERTKAIRPPA